MTLYQLKVFVTVAKLSSFTQASRSLGVRQPSVSLLIQNLQRELGTKLFDRLSNKIQLTRAGEELIHRAEDILADVDQLREKIDEICGLKKGSLTIGGSVSAGVSFLPLAIKKFSESHPGIEISLKIQASSIIEKALLGGEIDIAAISRVPESSLLVHKHYQDEEIVVIAPKNHPLTKRRSVSLKLLAKEPFVVSRKGESQIRDRVEKIFAQSGLPFKVALEISTAFSSRDVIRAAVADGLGVGFGFLCNTMATIKAGQVKRLKVPELKLTQSTYIVVHKSRQKLPLVKAFSDYLRRYEVRGEQL